jgi:hypothetical protein
MNNSPQTDGQQLLPILIIKISSSDSQKLKS